jgi:hypothetical protein
MTAMVDKRKPVVWTSGWARNEVRTFSSSWEWWTAWKRQRAVIR